MSMNGNIPSKIRSRCGWYICDGELPENVRDEILDLCPGNGASCNVRVDEERYPLFYHWVQQELDKLPDWARPSLRNLPGIEVEWSW